MKTLSTDLSISYNVLGITPFDPDGVGNKGNSISDISLLCNTCSEAFKTPWDLMVHAQSAHSMHIFEYKNDENSEDDDSISKENIGANLNSRTEIFSTAIDNYTNEIRDQTGEGVTCKKRRAFVSN